MKLLVLFLAIMLVPSICFAGYFSDKVDQVNQVVDNHTDKLTDKTVEIMEKAFDWVVKKVLSLAWFATELFMIFAVGWLMSLMCSDRDSRKAIKILVVLCMLSLTVDKLKSLIS